jgi:hypothetical protein
MPRLCRSNSAVPISASSALMRWVTLDGIQLFGGPGDAAEPGDRGKGEQVGQFHLGPPFQFRDGSVL